MPGSDLASRNPQRIGKPQVIGATMTGVSFLMVPMNWQTREALGGGPVDRETGLLLPFKPNADGGHGDHRRLQP